MENLEDIQSLNECQLACQYLMKCTFFVYDSTEKNCKLTADIEERICDIIHGMADPPLQNCLDKLPWAKN